MNKKFIAITGLLICLAGVIIQILDYCKIEFYPKFLQGKGLWLLIIGSSFSYIYSVIKSKKNEE